MSRTWTAILSIILNSIFTDAEKIIFEDNKIAPIGAGTTEYVHNITIDAVLLPNEFVIFVYKLQHICLKIFK